jgi:SHS2 domain-containing protein
MEKGPYEELEHTADWALRIRAPDFAGLLQRAAEGMLGLIEVKPLRQDGAPHLLELEGLDREDLLVRWLEEFLYALEARGTTFLLDELEVVDDQHLRARVREVPATRPRKDIKAVTYHGLEIRPADGGLEATVVFDV